MSQWGWNSSHSPTVIKTGNEIVGVELQIGLHLLAAAFSHVGHDGEHAATDLPVVTSRTLRDQLRERLVGGSVK